MENENIHFFYELKGFKLQTERDIREWILNFSIVEKIELGQINFIFCNDSYLLDINIKYLNHDCFTDIITFDNSENSSIIQGDIFISIERAKENASKFEQVFEHEINRLIIHGLLHLVGYEDKKAEAKLLMTEKEDYYLEMLK